MHTTKLIVYALIWFLMFSEALKGGNQEFVAIVFVSSLYISTKDHNVRSLLLITLFIHTFFYELDYFIYVLTKYYIPTGPIVGDLILNIFVLINLVVCLFAIFYRSEVMSFLRRVLKLKPVVYIPTRADYLMIFVLRLSLLAYGVFFLYNAFVAFQYNLAFAEEKIRLDNKLMDIGHLYLTISERIDLFLYMPIILVLTDWSKERYKQSMFF